MGLSTSLGLLENLRKSIGKGRAGDWHKRVKKKVKIHDVEGWRGNNSDLKDH